MQERPGPGNLRTDVHQVSSHRMVISIGKVDFQIQLAGRACVSQQRARIVQTGGRQRGDVRVNQSGQLRALHHQKRGLVSGRHF